MLLTNSTITISTASTSSSFSLTTVFVNTTTIIASTTLSALVSLSSTNLYFTARPSAFRECFWLEIIRKRKLLLSSSLYQEWCEFIKLDKNADKIKFNVGLYVRSARIHICLLYKCRWRTRFLSISQETRSDVNGINYPAQDAMYLFRIGTLTLTIQHFPTWD